MRIKQVFYTQRNVAKILLKHFIRESRRGRLITQLNDPVGRVATILRLSKKKLSRWLQEDETIALDQECIKGTKKKKLDDFDRQVIKRAIENMFQNNTLMTLRKLKIVLRESHDIHVSKTGLWREVRKMGFTFRKTKGNQRILCDRAHLVAARCTYLRQIRQKRSEGYDIVYLDETWVNAHHTKESEWVSTDMAAGRNIPSSKGKRIIVAHAGSEQVGFIPGCGLVFESHTTDGRDYHKEMNAKIFNSWMKDTLLPALDRPSVLVMDNASYHNCLTEESKVPNSASTKDDIKRWLEQKGIPYDANAFKPELLRIVTLNKPSKKFEVDEIIHAHGHTCIRLPPYHSTLNPIELVWASIKNHVADCNSTFKLPDVKRLTNEAIHNTTQQFWQRCVRHVLRLEQDYWDRDGVTHIQNPMVISLQDSSDSD